MTQFELLCSIEVFHTYYQNNICRDLQLQPDLSTNRWLQQNQLIWRQLSQNRWGLLKPTNFDVVTFAAENPAFKLVFEGTSIQSFIQFTQYPVDQLGVISFSNIRPGEISGSVVNLPGKFIQSAKHSAIMEVELTLSKLGSTATQYQISFQARTTRWQYYILAQQLTLNGTLALQGENASLFSGPEQVTLANGQEAILFDSGKNLLAINESGTVQLGLAEQKEGSSASPTVLLAHLPNPSPSSLTSGNEKGEDLISAMYIYV